MLRFFRLIISLFSLLNPKGTYLLNLVPFIGADKSRFPSSVVRVELEPGPVGPKRIIKAGETAEQPFALTQPSNVDVVVHVSPNQVRPLLQNVVDAAKSSKIVEVARALIVDEKTAVIRFAPNGTCETCQPEIIVEGL